MAIHHDGMPRILALRAPLVPIALAVIGLVVAGCETRPPLNRGQVVGIADNVCLGDSLNWGEPVEVLEPGEADAQGKRWWQVRYFATPGSAPRIILVDDASHWGRRLPDGQPIRVRAKPDPDRAPVSAVSVREGSFVLVLVEPAERSREDAIGLEREAVRLNGLASGDGLPPLFLARTDSHDRVSLLYGWQADHGITADDAVRAWVTAHGYAEPRWVDLLTDHSTQ